MRYPYEHPALCGTPARRLSDKCGLVRSNAEIWTRKELHKPREIPPEQVVKLQETEGETTARAKLEAVIWSSGYSYRVQSRPIGAKLGAL